MMFERGAGVPMKSIPYKGGAPLLQDLMGGQVPVAFNVISEVLPHVQERQAAFARGGEPAALGGAARGADAWSSWATRTSSAVEFLGWYAPAKTSPELVRKLNAAVQEALASPEMQEVLARNGLLALRESPEAFAQRVKDEVARWAPIVKATGFTPED